MCNKPDNNYGERIQEFFDMEMLPVEAAGILRKAVFELSQFGLNDNQNINGPELANTTYWLHRLAEVINPEEQK